MGGARQATGEAMTSSEHYDVIVVGGRPAGSTLAARLGQAGLRVLVLERTALPSRPAASAPAIYAKTMALLDEIGADEADYAAGTPPIRRWITEYRDAFVIVNGVPDIFGRDYGYAIDRARFDHALWRVAARQPSVTVRAGRAVTDLLWAAGRVAGVVSRAADGTTQTDTADVVVGADGRFSLVARKVGAPEHHRRDDLPTTLYYAYWSGARPYDAHGPAIHAYAGRPGLGYLLMDSADGSLAVVIEGQAALLEPGPGQSAEAFYEAQLRAAPNVWARLRGAARQTDVRGLKRVRNLYRQAGGPGWALVGDALHQKDPLDGQGIFDAVFTARALAEAITAWRRGGRTWEQALADYEAAVRAETLPMYRETLRRVRRDLYTPLPDWFIRTVGRWLLDDPEIKRRVGLLLVRGLSPDAFTPPPGVALRALLRGLRGRRPA